MTYSSALAAFGAAVLLFAPAASAQSSGFLAAWRARVLAAENAQPHWATPLITTTTVLDQTLRTDFQHSTQPHGDGLWNLGAGKGLKLVVAPRIEVDVNPAPYLIHQPNHATDGFGDVSFTAKYRVLARPENRGNWVLTALFNGTYPTGAYRNGARNATVGPALGGGKGFGPFVLESVLGSTLPTQGTAKAGRAINWNTAALFHARKHLWFQLESNAAFYKGGSNDGKAQHYLTPGIIARFRNQSREGLTVAAGMQFATTATHSGDHVLVLSGRLHF